MLLLSVVLVSLYTTAVHMCTQTQGSPLLLPLPTGLLTLDGLFRFAVPDARRFYDVCPPTTLGFLSLACPSSWASQDIADDPSFDVCPPTSLGFLANACPSAWATSSNTHSAYGLGWLSAFVTHPAILVEIVCVLLFIVLSAYCSLRVSRDLGRIRVLEANIAELQKALEGRDDGDELCQQKLARYDTWIGDIKIFANQAKEKIADVTGQISALTIARDKAEAVQAEAFFTCDTLLRKIDGATFTHLERAHSREEEVFRLQIRSFDLEDTVESLFHQAIENQVSISQQDDAYTERLLRLREDLDAIEVKIELVEERTAARTLQFLDLEDKLSIARSRNTRISNDINVLRQCQDHLQLDLQHTQTITDTQLSRLQEDLTIRQGQLLEAQAREVAEQTKASHLQESFNTVKTQTQDAQETFITTYSAAQDKITELTTTLDARKATLAASQAQNLALESQRSATEDRITKAKARIAAATLKKERLLAERAERERLRSEEFDALRRTSDGLRTARDASLAQLEDQRAALAHVQQQGAAEIATAETIRAEAKKAQDATIAALEAKKRTQAKEIDHLTKGCDSYQAKVDRVGTDTEALDVRFEEDQPYWEERKAERMALEHQREQDLAKFQATFADIDSKRTAAEEKAKAATEAAVAAETQSQADEAQLKQAMKAFEQQLSAARGRKTELEATVKTLSEKRDAEAACQEELVEKINTLPPSHADQLEDLAKRLERSEAEVLEKRAMDPFATPAVLEREAKFADMVEGEAQLRAFVEELQVQLTDKHAELAREQVKKSRAIRKRRAAERKVATLQAVLATPLPSTPALEASRGSERSPSLTPPPQTPEAGSSSWTHVLFGSKKK